jgi:hypothetical protein
MKKVTIFSSLFLVVFGLTLGITALSTNALAHFGPCTAGCVYELYCDDYIGPRCPDPNYPHMLWAINGQCLDGDPEHFCFSHFVGCCNKP